MSNKNTKNKSSGNAFMPRLAELNPYEYALGALILFALAVIPLLAGYVPGVPSSPEEMYMLRFGEEAPDLLAYNRSAVIKIVTIIMGIVFAADFYSCNFGKRTSLSVKANPLEDTGWMFYLKRPEMIAYIVFFIVITIVALVNNQSQFGVFGINEANSILFSMPLYFFVFSPLVFIIIGRIKSNISKPLAIACLVFFICAMLTTAFSKYKYLNFHGSAQRYESIYALLGYIIIFLSVIRFADTARRIKAVVFALTFSAFFLGVIAIFQMFGRDFFSTDFAARLFYGELYVAGETGFTPLFTTSAYSLLYNPNCLGLYASMIATLFFFSSVFMSWRNPLKYLFIIMFGISIAALLASKSTTGAIGAGIAFIIGFVIIVIYCLHTQKNVVPLFITVAVSVVIAAGAILLVPNLNSTISYAVSKIFTTGSTKENYFLKNLKADGNEVEIVTSAGGIKLKYFVDDKKVEVRFNDELVSPTSEEEPDQYGIVRINYSIPGAGSYQVSYLNASVSFSINGIGYNFYADTANEDKLYFLTSMGIPMDINDEIPGFGFNGNEQFANGRGYVWSRTLPMLKSTLIKGNGADSFVVAFPHYDVVGKTRFLGNPNMLWDKPHNGYLQYAVNTGVVSLVAILFLLFYFISRGIKSIVTRDDDDRLIFSLKFGLVMAVIAYCITFFTTDSTVGVSPAFWGLFGLGIAVMQLSDTVSEQRKQYEKAKN